jgi:peptidoglycan L-alanyl-D-glutamate endopeptidase CwlK
MDEVSEARLADLYPGLADKVRQMASMLAAEDIYIRVTAGLRTVAEQDELYAKGRTAPGSIVTNVRGGFSWHNFGLAVDLVPGVIGLDPWQPDWKAVESNGGKSLTSSYIRMVTVASSLGLQCGALWEHFKDYDHFQMNGQFPVAEPNDEVRQLASGGIEKIWDQIQNA